MSIRSNNSKPFKHQTALQNMKKPPKIFDSCTDNRHYIV